MTWFSLLVLIPLVAVLMTGAAPASHGGRGLGVTVVNIVMGTALARVLVRDRFWGRRLLDIVMSFWARSPR